MTRNTGLALFCQQMQALLYKRLINTWRSRALSIAQILVPVLFTLLALLFTVSNNESLIETMIVGYCASSTECSDHNLKKYAKSFFFQISVVFFSAWCDKRISNEKLEKCIFDSYSKTGKLRKQFSVEKY